MVKNLYECTAEFITDMVNYHGANEPGPIQTALTKMQVSVDRLTDTMTTEQKEVLKDVENDYSLVDGETMRYYYKAGFGDAIRFLVDWGKQRDQ